MENFIFCAVDILYMLVKNIYCVRKTKAMGVIAVLKS